ncbi:TetR/AcrR family transcriptional regulator [Microbacterium sp. NPDC058342]|uniref:TetR/AcrR family transcriptional regulator n=1 Tax=Microbacterium sp. NPDC058342 TaxID=3346454 RepID=UPI0036540ACB
MASGQAALPVQKRAWDTRERILDAAVTCLAEHGYAATTTSRIQERAGVSRGSLLHQFPARDDLLIAAVQHLAQQWTNSSPAEEGGGQVSIDEAVEILWASFQGTLFRAALQLWAAADHRPELAAALRPRERELGMRIRAVIAERFGPECAAHPLFEDLTRTLLSSMRGVALTHTFQARDHERDPNLPGWKRLAHHVLESSTD